MLNTPTHITHNTLAPTPTQQTHMHIQHMLTHAHNTLTHTHPHLHTHLPTCAHNPLAPIATHPPTCAHKVPALPVAEVVEHFVPVRLYHAGVDEEAGVAKLCDLLRQQLYSLH